MGMPFPQSISDVLVGETVNYNKLTLAPLFGPSTGPQVATLKTALINNDAEITEVSEEGDVNQLLVINKSLLGLLLLDGEELIGAKQNRILNTTVICAADSQTRIPVSCVERGRWAHRSRTFSSEERTMPSSMRRNKAERVAKNVVDHGTYDADQTKMWQEVDAYSMRRGVNSATHAMTDVLEQDHSSIEDYAQAFQPQPKQSGVAVYIGGRLAGIDLFGLPEIYAAMHSQILRSYAADAVEHASSNTNKNLNIDAKELLMKIEHAHMSSHQPPGIGRNLQFDNNELTASALILDGELVHLAAFSK